MAAIEGEDGHLRHVPGSAVNEATTAALLAIYKRRKTLTAELVLDAAAKPTHVLHREFEWDDAVAGHQYRLVQARALIRRVEVVISEQPVRAFPFIGSLNSFVPIETVMSNVDWRAEMVEKFRRDADAFAARWRSHKFVADTYAAWLEEQVADQAKAS